MQSGIVCLEVKAENYDDDKINDVWWTEKKKKKPFKVLYRISLFQFSITEGCPPFTYSVAVIELGAHS